MAMRSYYLENLEIAIRDKFGCGATHRETVFVHERSADNQSLWFGDVEVFDLIDCEGNEVCYAWQSFEGGIRTVVILHSDAVGSPQRAVQSAIASGLQPSMGANNNTTPSKERVAQPKAPLYDAPMTAEDLHAVIQAMWRPRDSMAFVKKW